jgi:hypothetical protein
MSQALAILAVAALHLVLLAPAAFAFWRPRAARAAGALYAAFFLVLAFHYFGLPGQTAPDAAANAQTADAARARLLADACARIIGQGEQTGLITDRSDPSRVIVAADKWAGVPAQARVALTACFDRSRPEEARGVPVEIVKR